VSAFPSPYSIETPAGCEGWEELYPYYALFTEERREADENRLWFWNSMHFPLPMPPFDVTSIDGPYYALGNQQNRAFAVPPAMGVDYRSVNGYIYITGNPVTDPEKIAERAEHFMKLAGYYYSNWDRLYGQWRGRMEELIAEITDLEVPSLPEYEPEDVLIAPDGSGLGERPPSSITLLDAYRRALHLSEVNWQHHFQFLLLGYGAYLTFSELCKAHLPDIPDQHIAQMISGIDVLLFRPDAELRRLAKLAVDTGIGGAFTQGRTPEDIEAELAGGEAGRAWLAELEAIKDPWFNMGTGDGLYHYFGSWFDDPSIPYASLIAHVAAIESGQDVSRPTEFLQAERDRLATEYAALLDEDARKSFQELLALSRMVFPYVEEHKFYCDYWFLTRWYNKIREFGTILAQHGFLADREDVFMLNRHEVLSALEELVLSWSTGGAPQGPFHWPPIVQRRRELLERLESWTPPPALGRMPEAVTDSMVQMLWGVTPQLLADWAESDQEGLTKLTGYAASVGEVEGPARVLDDPKDIGSVRDGEVLVCTVTSPAWAPIFPKVKAVVTDIGGVMSHAAIVSREYGMPAVVGTGRATAVIRTGQLLRVDGSTGVVTIVDGDGDGS
jgi:pyruvate,water dikinase